MEKDLKNDSQKMISSTTDQKDDAAMNEGGTGSDSSTTDPKGDDVAMNQGSAKMEEDHQKESGDDDVALNVGGTGSDSSASHQKDVSSGDDVALSDSSTLPLPKKRKLEWVLASGPSETKISSKKRNGSPHDEDVVDAIYQLSEKYNHRRFVNVISLTGSVSDVFLCDQFGSFTREITAATLMEEEKKSAGESYSAAAQDGNSDSKKAIEELESLPATLPAADGQDKKSPSE